MKRIYICVYVFECEIEFLFFCLFRLFISFSIFLFYIYFFLVLLFIHLLLHCFYKVLSAVLVFPSSLFLIYFLTGENKKIFFIYVSSKFVLCF